MFRSYTASNHRSTKSIHKLRYAHRVNSSSLLPPGRFLVDSLIIIIMAPFEKDNASFYSNKLDDSNWRNVDEHQGALSFSRVIPVHVHVRDLEVSVKTKSQSRLPWQSEVQTPTPCEAEAGTTGRQKTIVGGISADFTSGSLSAIIGGSGSGKVCHTFHESYMQRD